ncbi:hypothetical protein PV379_01655 [Streptomyces caniscabiei]|uniref:glycine-rich domain-containing protein n=1 Tax=Streptomyces caniscabiei TaxID=2746961 RepID=UPI0029B6C264|nr:hypothetical protein [Streptomyces caniscabiei]MDX2776059.1 hypothetical protein [Streptomyces caniscabiei]
MKLLKGRKQKAIHLLSTISVVAVIFAAGAYITQTSRTAYAAVDRGLDSGNATVDRTSVPGQTILLYKTTGTSTFKAPTNVSNVHVLVIGGGGSGGSDIGGGGGAGGLIENASFGVTAGTSLTVSVGSGGVAPSSTGTGADGGNSAFGSLIAIGGGGGGYYSGNPGRNGGSGGGSGGNGIASGGTGTAGQGNNGGSKTATTVNGRGSGGGGAGAVGANGTASAPGVGGDGLSSDITGTTTFYAGGGGGAGRNDTGNSVPGAFGGSGGGGRGGGSNGAAAAGATNTGSGGGGGNVGATTKGGDGGSGIVVVRFATQNWPDPGGIASGIFSWQRADDGSSTGALWKDVSGNGSDATQGTATSQPTFTANGINFNPAFQFDGTDDFLAINKSFTAATAGEEMFAAVLPESAGGANILGMGNIANTTATEEFRYINNTLQFGAAPSYTAITSPTATNGFPQIANAHRFKDNTTPAKLHMNGTEVASGTVNARPSIDRIDIGARRIQANDNQTFKGMMAEVLLFNRELTAAERQRVTSYLGIKYGTTLSHDYLDSAGAKIWDYAASTAYNNDIAGIGRDDTTSLNQKQSKSVNGGSLVTIGRGDIAATNQANSNTFANDKTFMTWGHDTAATTQATTVTGTSYARMARIWKSVTTGTVGQVKVQLPTSSISRSSAVLLVSDSPTFDNTSQVIPMTANGSNYEALATFTGTKYFTFGSPAGSDIEFVSKTATDISNTTITAYTPGQPLEYHLVVKNNGPDAAGTVTVTDTLPAGIIPAANGATGSGWSCTISGQTVTCTRASLAAGVTAPEILIEATIASSVTGSKTNTASASVANDPNTGNNSKDLTLDAQPEADLSITKAHTGTATAGQPLTYDFVVTNDGPSDVASFTVTDTLDANLTYQSSSPNICTVSGQDVTCTGSAVPAGQTATFTVTANVDAGYGGGGIANTGTVAVPSGTTDPNPGNNSSTDNTNVVTSTDLAISKTHSGNFIAGENNTFTISVTNNGPSSTTAGGISITDTLDADFAYVSAVGTDWTCSHNNGTVTCSYGVALASTATAPPITLTVLVDSIAKGSTTNTADVTATTPDPDLTNNTSTDTVTITSEADLALTKAHVGTAFTAGQQEQYTLTVTNAGPSADAPSYTITDTLPAGVSFVSATGDATCSASGQNVTCTGGGIAVGAPAQVTTITVAIAGSATGTITNTATVAPAPGTTDPNTANNTSTDNASVEPNADLSITKTHAGDLTAGSNATYTFTVTNNGPSDVTSYTITDTLNANLTYVSATGATCSAVNQDVTCTGGTINSGDSATVTLTVHVTPSAVVGLSISNTATVAPPAGVNDPDMSNNSSSVSNAVAGSADLAIQKSHTGNFMAGTNGNFTITVTNNGPSDVDSFTVTDTLPASLTYVSATGDGTCATSGQTVTCSGSEVDATDTATITLTVAVVPSFTGTTLANTASVASSVPDPDTNNNSSTDTVTLDQAQADLAATKVAQGPLMAGQPVTYRFTVTNNGPDNAGAVKIDDSLPGALSYQSFTNVTGSWNCSASGQDVTCTLDVLNNGDTATVDVTTLVAQDAPDSITNDATVSFNGTDTSANTPSATDSVNHSADLGVKIEREDKLYYSGEQVLYTYVITNSGPSAANDVVVKDTIPSGLVIDSISKTGFGEGTILSWIDAALSPKVSAADNPFSCSLSGSDLECTASPLMVGTYNLYVTAHIADGFTGQLSNALTISSSTPDPNPNNNEYIDTISDIQPAPGLSNTGQNLLGWSGAALLLAATGAILYRWRVRRA